MIHLRFCILLIDIVIGISAFTALFHSSLGITEKTYFALVFLLLAFIIEVHSIESATMKENFFEGLFAALQAIEKRIEGQDAKVCAAVESKIKELEIQYIAQGHVYRQVLLFSGRFGVWVIGGWLVENFLLPLL